MGVTKLQSRFINPASASVPNIVVRSAPNHVSSLLIDGASKIYKAVSVVCGYSTKTGDAAAYSSAVVWKGQMTQVEGMEGEVSMLDVKIAEKTSDLLAEDAKTIKPTEVLYIAMDGVPPLSKVNQQRKRRIMGARIAEQKREEGKSAELVDNARILFDTSNITPGSRFMQLLDIILLRRLPYSNPNSTYRLVYSSYREEGEGEHKIMDALRSNWIPHKDARVIISPDSDMILLAASLQQQQLYVYRDNMEGTWIDISQFKYYLNSWGPNANIDLVLILQVLGNDFVPPQPSYYPGADGQVVDSSKSHISSLQTAYKTVGVPLLINHPEEMEIDWDAFRQFMQLLANEEYSRLYYVSRDKSDEDPRWSTVVFPPIDLSTVSDLDKEERYQAFRAAWYDRALSDVEVADRPRMILDMIEQYLKTLVWTCIYYVRGHKEAKISFTYPYSYPPLLRDVVGVEWSSVIDYITLMTTDRETYESEMLTLPELEFAVVPNEEDLLGIVRSLYPTYFPNPLDVQVDGLGIAAPSDEQRELYAIDLMPLLTDDIRTLLSKRNIRETADDDEVADELLESLEELYQAERYEKRPTVVLIRKTTIVKENIRRQPINSAEVTERLAKKAGVQASIEEPITVDSSIMTINQAPKRVTAAPVKAPAKAPVKAPVKAPAKVPVKAPAKVPVKAPAKAPVKAPVKK